MAELIHCITNPISMMQCANAILSLGAKPIMAEHPGEVAEITATASALLLNTGNISDSKMEAMQISFEMAMSMEIPVVIDAVGIACSTLRRDFVLKLLEKYRKSAGFLLIKGNYSEIKALYDASYRGKGVDAEESLNAKEITCLSKELSKNLGAAVLASGAGDIVVFGDKAVLVKNGVPQMGNITGTGCMLGAVCATFLSRECSSESIADACAFFGIAGETAAQNENGKPERVGCGSFLIRLLDALSCIDPGIIKQRRIVEDL